MRRAGHLGCFALAKQSVEPGIPIGMDPAFVAGEVADRMMAFAIDGALVPGARRCLPVPRPLVPDIGPGPCCAGAFVSGAQHLDRRVIGKQRRTSPHMASNCIGHPCVAWNRDHAMTRNGYFAVLRSTDTAEAEPGSDVSSRNFRSRSPPRERTACVRRVRVHAVRLGERSR